jgi:hypothetical protein
MPFLLGPGLQRRTMLKHHRRRIAPWYNTSWPMHHLGRIPPVEAEANYYDQTSDGQPAAHT